MRGTVARSLLQLSRIQEGSLVASCSTINISGTPSKGIHARKPARGTRHRHYTTGSNVISPDFTLRSPLPDIDIPAGWTVHEEVFQACDLYGDNVAMEEFMTGKSITFTELKNTATRVASALHKQGYRKGDVVVVFSINCIDFAVLALACSVGGLWFSPANAQFTPGELARQIQLSGASAVFVSDVLAPIATAALADTQATGKVKGRFSFGAAEGYLPMSSLEAEGSNTPPDVTFDTDNDIFALPYSSGTTGLPKGVMLSQMNVMGNMRQLEAGKVVAPGDSMLGLLPFSHIYGLTVNMLMPLGQGCKVVTLPKFEPEPFLKCLMGKQITVAPIVPPLILFLAKHPVVSSFDLTSIHTYFSAAAPLGKETTEEFLKRHSHGARVLQGYGLTETSPAINTDTVGIAGSVGSLVSNTIGKMIDPETRQAVGPGQEGEYYIKGPQVMKGYHNNEQATREMVDDDGWLQTGDLGYFTEEGVVYISERLKELIKYKGSQVSPAELENLLLTFPGIADCAVIGVPDEVAGELPKAFVVKQPGQDINEKAIIDFVEGQVSRSKRLRGGVEFIEAIPKNPSGKILRRVLKAQVKAQAANK